MTDDTLPGKAFLAFDTANTEDPNRVDGEPRELVFARRLTQAVMKLEPNASEALRLASRCQHICRWEVPRNTEPMGRSGYLKWRSGLKKFHAAKSAEILREVGYDAKTILRVQNLNLKKNLKSDPDCQTLEDALCLVFLQYQLDTLIANTETDKMLHIIRKTWQKMSPGGQMAARKLDYSAQGSDILAKALNS